VKQFKILPGDRILVALSQEPHLIGVIQIFQLGGITAELLVISANGAGVLYPPMNHLFLAVAADLKGDGRQARRRGDDHQRHHQHEREHYVALFLLAGAMPSSRS